MALQAYDNNNPIIDALQKYRDFYRLGAVSAWNPQTVLETAGNLITTVVNLSQESQQLSTEVDALRRDTMKSQFVNQQILDAFEKGKMVGKFMGYNESVAQAKEVIGEIRTGAMEIVEVNNKAYATVQEQKDKALQVYEKARDVERESYERVNNSLREQLMYSEKVISEQSETIKELNDRIDKLRDQMILSAQKAELVQDPYADRAMNFIQRYSNTAYDDVRAINQRLQKSYEDLQNQMYQKTVEIEQVKSQNDILKTKLKEAVDVISKYNSVDPTPAHSSVFTTKGINHKSYVVVSPDILNVTYEMQPTSNEFFIRYPWIGVLKNGTVPTIYYGMEGKVYEEPMGSSNPVESDIPKKYDALVMFQN